MSNTFKLPEIILNNLKNESNTDENIFCVYNYVQEHINNDDDLEQLYLAIIEFKPNAHFVGQYAWELFKKNRTAVAVSLMKNKEKYSGDDFGWEVFKSSEQDILLNNSNTLEMSGDLKITIEGRLHRMHLGVISDEIKNGLEKAISFLDEYENIEALIEEIWFGNPAEIFENINDNDWEEIITEFPIIQNIKNSSWGDLWENFDIFYSPWIIDKDNIITITLNNEPLFKDTFNSMMNQYTTKCYRNNNETCESKIDLNTSLEYPYNWDESFLKDFNDSEDFAEDFLWDYDNCIFSTIMGWFCNSGIYNENYKEKIKEVQYGTNRISITEYGKYKLVSDGVEIQNFDKDKLVYFGDSNLVEFGPTTDQYVLTEMFYNESGIFESLNFIAADFILKSVNCDLNWPTDE